MLTFDFSDAEIAVPPLPNLTQFKLLYRSTPSGAFSILPVVATSGGTDKIQFALSNVQLQNGYYTVGYSNGILWTGQQNSQWDLPANWSSNSVPTSADLVIIENCSTCPELSASVVVAGAAISGSSLTLENHTFTAKGAISIVSSAISSEDGKIEAYDISEMKLCSVTGKITLEKKGSVNTLWYGGNHFTSEVKFVNSATGTWNVGSIQETVVDKN